MIINQGNITMQLFRGLHCTKFTLIKELQTFFRQFCPDSYNLKKMYRMRRTLEHLIPEMVSWALGLQFCVENKVIRKKSINKINFVYIV